MKDVWLKKYVLHFQGKSLRGKMLMKEKHEVKETEKRELNLLSFQTLFQPDARC